MRVKLRLRATLSKHGKKHKSTVIFERKQKWPFGNGVCNAFHPEQGFNYPYMPKPRDCCFLSRREKIKMSLNRFSFLSVLLLAVKTGRLLDKYISLQNLSFVEKLCHSISYLQPLGVIINTFFFCRLH